MFLKTILNFIKWETKITVLDPSIIFTPLPMLEKCVDLYVFS